MFDFKETEDQGKNVKVIVINKLHGKCKLENYSYMLHLDVLKVRKHTNCFGKY